MRELTDGVRLSLRIMAGAIVLAAALLALGISAVPAAAATGERIDSYATDTVVSGDGDLGVTETIRYDFGGSGKHGIYRNIPVRFRYNKDKNRIYRIDINRVTMDGKREPHDRTDSDGQVKLKIGSSSRTLSGVHTYVISYTVKGALNGFPDHEELYWNAIGDQWDVPVDNATATVVGPAPIGRIKCFAGPAGSRLGCTGENSSGNHAAFVQTSLNPREAFSVVVGFPKGSVGNTKPILEDRHDFAAAFQPSFPAVIGGIIAAALGVLAALFVAWRVGRDRVYVGQIPALAPVAGQVEAERRKPLFGKPPITVQFTPPQGIKPGEVGTLLDERANTVDVTATIVDFAVRKYLHITEIPAQGRWGKQDWELTKLAEPDDTMLPYEQTLYNALFLQRTSVRLSALKNTFATQLGLVQKELYISMVRRGWYRQSPETSRSTARLLGAAALLGAIVVTYGLYRFTHVALIGVGLIVGALVALASSGFAPARTGRGSAALGQVLGFRQYLMTAEANQIAYEEREDIFSRYLPYAIVFGVADRWAATFADIGAVQPDGSAGLYWYTGVIGWNMAYFGQSIGSFNTVTSGTIAATPPSASGSSGFSGGGFSGGGGGGGGGGSW